MSENNMQDRSLCSNCRNSVDCTFPKDPQKPSLYCEEFELDICPAVETTKEEKSAASATVDAEDKDSGKFIGLCSNCDNRQNCGFPKPEGGIWHCEEYQ